MDGIGNVGGARVDAEEATAEPEATAAASETAAPEAPAQASLGSAQHAAAAHMYDPGATALAAKLGAPDRDIAPGAVGAAGQSDEAAHVDLGSHEKVEAFLAGWSQNDYLSDTKSDSGRCQSNSMMAALLLKGGPEGLSKGLMNAALKARERAENMTAAEKALDPARYQRLQEAAKTLAKAADAAQNNDLTYSKLDHAANALFETFASPDDLANVEGNNQGGMDKADIAAEEKALGLTDGGPREEVNATPFGGHASDQVWGDIKPGQCAHVDVMGDGEWLAKGHGPHGEPIEKKDGTYCYLDKTTQPQQYMDVEGPTNHAVVFGREKDGARYIYNPEGHPNLVKENPNDAQSVKDFEKLSHALMGKKDGLPYQDTSYAYVTKYDKSN
jgi:hypothetical protein